MKKIYFLILFIFAVQVISAQGMFTERGKFSLDAGAAYINNHVDDYDAIAYNLSASLFGIFDLGVIYSKAFPSKQYKRSEGATAYLDFYVKKDSSFGVVLNTAFSTFNYESALLAGISLYTKFTLIEDFALYLYPLISLAVVTTEDFAFGLGFAFEKNLSNSFSLVVTPGLNTSGNIAQLIVSLELILK